jgi:uncharacterized membrane protein (DUF4010 family)
LIGLIGYAIALLSGAQLLPVALGFGVVGGFLMLSYWHKLSSSQFAGVTTEMSGLATYVVGVLVSHEQFWIAATITVASMLLLELKIALEGLTKRISGDEILTFTKFLLLTAVVLPVLPNQEFTQFKINPFRTWLVVVAVSTVSYASYVIQRWTKQEGGLILAAILGGAYSSTVATVVLARRARAENHPHLFSGATLIASGMMYLRLTALLGLFNRSLLLKLGLPFAVLAVVAIGAGWLWSRRPDPDLGEVERKYEPKNPLEMRAAMLFALLFVGMLIVTHLVIVHLGKAGVYALAGLMGVVDVDPFIMGMTQSASSELSVAAAAIVIAAASNNVAKGVYAYVLSGRKTGILSLTLLVVLALLGLVPLVWLAA